MSTQHTKPFSRRRFLRGVTLAGTAGLLSLHARRVAAEPPPETTTLRLMKFPSLCLAPQYVAEELLRIEGFTDVQYLTFPEEGIAAYGRLASGELDITQAFVAPSIVQIDKGAPIVFLAGVHVGCFELFGTEQVKEVRDLKGTDHRRAWIGVEPPRVPQHDSKLCWLGPTDGCQLHRAPCCGGETAAQRGQD